MTTRPALTLLLGLTLVLPPAPPASAHTRPASRGFAVEILVDGQPVPQYPARGTRYVEALKGREYAIRLRNPLGVRVAVALSVDGLNTIDAQRTPAATARKWVLGPYETVTISGWQTSGQHARRFYFTTEEKSYAQWRGHTEDMGLVSAVFFRERQPDPPPNWTAAMPAQESGGRAQDASRSAPPAPAAAAPASAAPRQAGEGQAAKAGVAQESDYAATGIGREVQHRVRRVFLDLEPDPVAAVNVRYEYRAQLVKLGVLPDAPPADWLSRRERARGFDGFSPVPPR